MTPAQKRTVVYHGGLREKVTLAGLEIVLGELALRDRPAMFALMERDLKLTQKAWRSWIGLDRAASIPLIGPLVRSAFNIQERKNSAISTMSGLVKGLTESDVELILLCSVPFNPHLTSRQIKDAVLDSANTEVQEVIRKILDMNGIDLKKLTAARENPIPTRAASPQTTTGNAGSPASSS